MPYDHETISLWSPFEEKNVDIDCGISELIQELWKADINTFMSCENNVPENWIWIQFFPWDCEKFLDIVVKQNKYNEFYGRILNGISTTDPSFHEGKKHWRMTCHYDNAGSVKEPEFYMTVSIRFPKEDYIEVLKRIKKYNTPLKRKK